MGCRLEGWRLKFFLPVLWALAQGGWGSDRKESANPSVTRRGSAWWDTPDKLRCSYGAASLTSIVLSLPCPLVPLIPLVSLSTTFDFNPVSQPWQFIGLPNGYDQRIVAKHKILWRFPTRWINTVEPVKHCSSSTFLIAISARSICWVYRSVFSSP